MSIARDFTTKPQRVSSWKTIKNYYNNCQFSIFNSEIVMYYFYCFDNSYTHNIYQSTTSSSQIGDLLYFENKYYLNLWEEISRPEQWATTINFHNYTTTKWICNKKTIQLLHWMVNERFSSYNKCIPLFFGNDMLVFMKHKQQKSKKKISDQHLVIFPSVFSLTQYHNTHQDSNIVILTGQSTTAQRSKAYRSLHNNESQILYATHSQIFQDRQNLQSITTIDELSPLYQTHQEPRYNLWIVLQKLKEIYDINIWQKDHLYI